MQGKILARSILPHFGIFSLETPRVAQSQFLGDYSRGSFEAAELLGSLLKGPDHVSCRRLAEFCWMETAQRLTDSPQILESLPNCAMNDEGEDKSNEIINKNGRRVGT